MKREHHHHHHHLTPSLPPLPSSTFHPDSNNNTSSSSSSYMETTGKPKMWEVEEEEECDGMDELLAVLGYKVKSSDMAQVASKLEQLEQAMSCNVNEQLSGPDTVHYNPSDLSSYLQTMLNEINPPLQQQPITTTITTIDDDVDDLKAIPGKAVYNNNINININNNNKRLKSTNLINPCEDLYKVSNFITNTTQTQTQTQARPVVVVCDDDENNKNNNSNNTKTQENGIRLVHALMACAEAVQHNNLNLAEALVKQIGFLAISQTGAMRKVATYFAEALARRVYRLYPKNPLEDSLSNILQMHFYETCPYLKFAHFTANQAILEAFQGKKRVHVIDFSMNQGMQWPALMQALALRPGGPPAFRLTGIGPPAPDNSDHLQEVGWKLAQLAETIHVEFEYRGFVANSLADLDAAMLELRPSETESVAVNSVFDLHKLLARPGAIEKVLSVVKQMKPVIFTIVEQEANHNSPGFVDRFTESLHYYSTLFDSLEGSSVNGQDKVMSEVYLGKQICNVVASEGVDRVERHEPLTQWRNRLESAGFVPALLGSNAFKQASMLLALFAGGEGYMVEENAGCLLLGWHTRPLIATSAWKLGGELMS